MIFRSLIFFTVFVSVTACSVDAPESKAVKSPGQTPPLAETKASPQVVAEPVVSVAPAVVPHSLREAAGLEGVGQFFAYLAEHPAELESREADGSRIYHRLAQLDRVDLMQGLLTFEISKGATARDKEWRIPLHFARSRAMVLILAKYDVKVGSTATRTPAFEITDRRQKMPIHAMAERGDVEALEAAVELMCPPSASSRVERMVILTPLNMLWLAPPFFVGACH